MEPTADFLLDHPELVTPTAPWCVRVDGLELGALLLALPFMAPEGLKRATLERRLTRLGRDLPLGSVYFQRVKRAVARLVEIEAMERLAGGRQGRFLTTPRGFATLVVNLRVLDSDPTVDGQELELKRTLVSMWSLVFERLDEVPESALPAPTSRTERFFEHVESLEVLGRPLIDERFIEEAFDVLRLIADQRARVAEWLEIAELTEGAMDDASATVDGFDLTRLTADAFENPSRRETRGAGAVALVRRMAGEVLPRLTARARVARYRHYLAYLDDLTRLYAERRKTPPFEALRSMIRGREAS